MHKVLPWSYTALTAFETCPRRYKLTRLTKQVKEPPTDATIWGNKVHTALEHCVRDGTPLPALMQQWSKYAEKIRARAGKRIVEQRMTVDRSFNPTDWNSPTAWCRGIVDVGVIGDKRGVILDWKTGSRKLDTQQLDLFAVMAFAHYPWIERVSTGFIWLKEGKIDKKMLTREQIPEVWMGFAGRVTRMEKALADDNFVAKPSGLCAAWCPVGKTLCEFCGKH